MTTRWRRHPEALWRRCATAVVALPVQQQEPVVLDGSGATIWMFLDEPISSAALLERVATAFQVLPASVADEVFAFLEQLAASGLAVADPPAPSPE